MADVILSAVILVLLADRAWTTRQWARERRQMLDVVIARTPQELTVLRSQEAPRDSADDDLPVGFLGQIGL